MEWHDACDGSSILKSRYEKIPALDPFPIYYFQIEPAMPSLTISGYLPRLPDDPSLPEGHIPDRAELTFSFLDITSLILSGVPDQHGGQLDISRDAEKMTRFKYESVNFQFAGACQKAAVGGFSVIARHDPNHREPRGPCLFSHSNVWNSCLLLLQEFGYTLRAIGHPGQRDNPACVRWEATQPDRARLTGNTPIELLGLACLHRHFHPQVDEPYWWRMDGPLIVMDLIQEWQRRTDPTTIGDVNAP